MLDIVFFPKHQEKWLFLSWKQASQPLPKPFPWICTSRLPALKATCPHYQLPSLALKSKLYYYQAIFKLLFMSYNSNNMGLYRAKFRVFIGCLEIGIHVLSFTI